MKIAKDAAVAAIMLGIIVAAPPMRGAAAGDPAIFVANYYDVTAYPAGSSGDVAPIAVTPDMIQPSGIARDASGRIYTTNSSTNTITIYPADAGGNVAPVAVIGGSNTRLAGPTAIALDESGKVYVLNTPYGSEHSIAVYPPVGASTGILNEAPIAVIAGSKTRLKSPSAIALDSLGGIYVANERGGPFLSGTKTDSGQITVYPAGSDGNVAPVAIIRGAATGLAYPVGIALDSSGNIYVANGLTAHNISPPYYASITVYPAGSNGNSPPIAIIAGEQTGLTYALGIALDSGRNLYVTGYSTSAGYGVSVFSAGSSGNVAPVSTITGADTGLYLPGGIALDPAGNLYVSNVLGGPTYLGSVTVYAAGSSGDAEPISTITSNFTGVIGASGIAVDSTGNIYVANASGGVGSTGSVTIYSPGSYATVAPFATIAGDDTGLSFPQGIAVDSAGDMFVLNSGDAVTVYSAGSSGDVPPKATINIDRSGKSSPSGMAVNPRGDIYVENQGGEKCNRQSCWQISPDNVAVYPAGSDGNPKPSAVISGPDTGLESPSAIAVHDGAIYVANEGPMRPFCVRRCGCTTVPAGPGSISVYAPGSNGDVAPIATIAGRKTGLGFPYKIALDSEGKIYVLSAGGFLISFICIGTGPADDGKPGTKRAVAAETFDHIDPLIFAAGSHGDVPPIGSISGPFTGLNGPSGIAVGPAGP